jgi:hypothetical protein
MYNLTFYSGKWAVYFTALQIPVINKEDEFVDIA